jgi:transcriptional regulator with GAF, ATPase, and Fis domain
LANILKRLNADQLPATVYRQLFEMGNRLLKEKDIKRLLHIAMDMVIKISGAERGWMAIFKPESNEIMYQAFKNIQQKDIEQPEFRINRTIIENVKREGNPVCLPDIRAGVELKQDKKMKEGTSLSVICIPLLQDKNIFGVIYLDNHTGTEEFKPETFDFIKEFANFISTAVWSLLEEQQLQNLVVNIRKTSLNRGE